MITYPRKTAHPLGFAPPREPASKPASRPASERDGSSSVGLEAPHTAPEPMSHLETQTSPEQEHLAPDAAVREVLVLRGASELAPYVGAWQELADGAAEPNVFYEPWMLLPALEAFGMAPAPEFHLVFAPGRGPNSRKPQLCGLFPLVRKRGYKGLRTTVLRSWKHLYCALCTPLVRRGAEVETLGALLDFLGAETRGASLLELQSVSGDGPFGRALVETFGERGTTTFVDEIWTRAMLRPKTGATGEEYLKDAMSGKRRKEFRRKESRLSDEGAIEFRDLADEADPNVALEAYIADFLRIEASGWKGETGSAFACHPDHQQFFRAIVTQAHERGRLGLSMLCVGGQAIAAKCDFLAGTGAFAFKIGFDERFARFSPGVLLELEGIRQLHQSKLRWMDSCAVPNHPMINKLWLERRTLQTVVIATGRGRGEFVVAGLGLVRHFKRAARRKSRPIAAKPLENNVPKASDRTAS